MGEKTREIAVMERLISLVNNSQEIFLRFLASLLGHLGSSRSLENVCM
jgi:hypothetical protein